MYYRNLETDAAAKAEHDKNMKANAAARRAKFAAYKKKKKEEEDNKRKNPAV